jgi:DNA invertase Pin-like site-specific DNA recombinase
MNAIIFNIENVLEALSADSRQEIKFPDGRNSKWVRSVSIAVLLEKSLIPKAAGIGWMNNLERRKGCSPKQEEHLNELHRLDARARYHYREDGKKPKEATNYVSYTRVSTKKQGDSGLGLAAQKKDIGCYIKKVRGNLLGEYTEVGSGTDEIRPELMEAIEHCRVTGATLIVSKLDRLSRDLHFVSGLLKSRVKFVLVENPTASPECIAKLAVEAQYAVEKISKNTKAALGISTKPKGLKGKQNLEKNPGAAERGRALGGAAMKVKADLFATKVLPLIEDHQRAGFDLVQVAEMLNKGNILTARGKRGAWTTQQVKSILARAATCMKIEKHRGYNGKGTA